MIEAPLPEASQLLAGQIAFVTGASSGLGRRFAETLAAAGAKVAVAARRAELLDDLVATIEARGGQAVAIALDLADAAAIEPAVDRAQAVLGGPVTILVNNAGIALSTGALKQTLAQVDQLLAVNIRAPFLLSQVVAGRLIEAGQGGRIINLASIGAYNYDGVIPSAMYCTTKSAIVRLTETLSVEWAPLGISVNAIAPGFFRSEMSAPSIEAKGEEFFAALLPRKRIGEPHMLDSTLLYLASPASEGVTGTCIKVDDSQMPR
jgi:NAD(P)-dependent dehydrogenase (short-subunit alcohol dehydrogenase family)